MRSVVLLAKSYRGRNLKLAYGLLKSKLEGLSVEVKVLGTEHDWIQVQVSGQDEQIALAYLSKEIGFAPVNSESVTKFSTMKGYVAEIDNVHGNVLVDVGVLSPEPLNVTVLVHYLQSQLADGRKIALQKLATMFGITRGLPLTIKAVSNYADDHQTEAMLAETQCERYRDWVLSLLDRLILLGSTSESINSAVIKAGLERDVIDVESLGLFEHAIVCKLGTDATGLIPRLGRSLRQASFQVFPPKRIFQFFGGEFNLIVS